MRLITGPAGSGKTSYILDQFRAQTGANVRLLVPTATMAQHLQNRLAREGLVFRRSLIQTLSAFVRDWVEDTPEAPPPVLQLLTEEAARRVAHPDFARVVSLPGFSARLAATIHEFAGAGCDSARLAAHLPDAPLADAFLAVYREVDRELARRHLATRARRLQLAAERIAAQGLRGISTVWLDGFHALPDPELAVIAALDRHTDVTVALERGIALARNGDLPVSPVTEPALPRRRPRPGVQSFHAPNIEREADEIARRIIEQTAAGHAFRDIGIVVRTPETYAPVLRATLARFGIPARFYFDQPLDRHPAIRFLSGAIDAMLSGWDHDRTLAVLRLAPRFATLPGLDRFDFDVREQTPNSGLAGLHGFLLDDDGHVRAGDPERIAHKLDSLAKLEEWRAFSLHPKDWAARFKTLRNFFRPARPTTPATHDLALDWRSQSAALDAFDEALDEAALALDPGREFAIELWWRTVQSVLRLKPLRLDDGRRNVIHVLSAYEAREWSLPVMFVCGMVEKQFPRAHSQDPFFPDPARCRLHSAGIRVRTAAEFEIEERALFESALDTAASSVTLSWPDFDGRGDSTLKSLYLDEMMLPAAAVRSVRPPLPEPRPKPPSAIADSALLPILHGRNVYFSPTGLESFLQCPFQFFAGKTLRLKSAPMRPEERLDFMTQGNIVHEVLKEWWPRPQDIGALFERVYRRILEEKHVPFGYHTERLRNEILDDLHRFTAEYGWQRDVFTSRTELPFELPIGDFVIRGKIDRLDTSPDGKAYVIDYKYSAAAGVKKKLKNQNLLQAPLYMLAAQDVFHAHPEGMFYLGVKGAVVYAGWTNTPLLDSDPLPENWLEVTRTRAIDLVAQIRSGQIAPHPADPDLCRFCDYADACRIDIQAVSGAAE